MTSTSIETLLHQGIKLAKAGEKASAKAILGQVVRRDPKSVMGWLWLAGVVNTKEQQCYCLEQVLQLTPQNEVVKRVLGRLESDGHDVEPQAAYFLGYGLSASPIRGAITDVFGPRGCKPVLIDRSASTGRSRLLNICQKIYLNNFSIFDLSANNPNTYLELGIALGFNRPFVVIAHESSQLAFDAMENLILYRDRADLVDQLTQRCAGGFPPTGKPSANHCYLCNRTCEYMNPPPEENQYLVLNASKMLWRNVIQIVSPHLNRYDLHPLYLTERVTAPFVCDIRRKVLTTQFALAHLGGLSNPTTYLALGVAIGSRTPWLLLSQEGGEAPIDLRGVRQINYTNSDDLQAKLTDALSLFLGKILPGQAAPVAKTTALSLPFWTELEDWINRVKHATKGPESIQGALRLVRRQGDEKAAEYLIPRKGLSFGRSADCDVVIENPSVSARHFHVLKSRTNAYFIEDLNSKNGTFLNGTRLTPNCKVQIHPKDTIRIPGAHFLVWDERSLPLEKSAQLAGDTDLLPPILKIDIPDVPPPAYLNTWDHALELTVALPNRPTYSKFEVQAYYPMGKIIAQVVDLLGLPNKSYCFTIENQPIDNEETPLSAGIERNDVLTLTPQSRASIHPSINA
jgi:pSer/pThr/pTyr-binding forkhead associated (FHA) protein